MMEFLKRMIEIKWPFLLVEFVFLIGGIALITTGIKVRKKSKQMTLINIVTGVIISLVSIYAMYVTILFGYNS